MKRRTAAATADQPGEGTADAQAVAEQEAPEGSAGTETPAESAPPATIIAPPSEAPAPADPPIHPHTKISARAYAEETPRLTREAKDILSRIHAHERKTREEWDALAQQYGGSR